MKVGNIMFFKERLKQLRIETETKQEALARYLNVGISTVSMYETGQREPSLDILIKIAEYFNVSVDYLLGVKNEK